MPLLILSDWSGIPGIVVVAPTFQCFDAAYAEQVMREQWNINLKMESYEVTTPWAREQARIHWEMYRPWWTRF